MKILTVETRDPTLRSTVEGWTCEDTDAITRGDSIGMNHSVTMSTGFYSFTCVMYAIVGGYKLLGPPTKLDDKNWLWWLTKD